VIGKLDARGNRQCSAVQSVEAIAPQIMRRFGCLPDSGYDDQLMGLLLKIYQGLF
jgi:hypothetical protein